MGAFPIKLRLTEVQDLITKTGRAIDHRSIRVIVTNEFYWKIITGMVFMFYILQCSVNALILCMLLIGLYMTNTRRPV